MFIMVAWLTFCFCCHVCGLGMDSTALIGVVVLVVAAVVGYLFLSGGSKKAGAPAFGASSKEAFVAEPDAKTEKMLPYMKTRAGPRDPEWPIRLKEELTVLMKYCKEKKDQQEDWFEVNPVPGCKDFTK